LLLPCIFIKRDSICLKMLLFIIPFSLLTSNYIRRYIPQSVYAPHGESGPRLYIPLFMGKK